MFNFKKFLATLLLFSVSPLAFAETGTDAFLKFKVPTSTAARRVLNVEMWQKQKEKLEQIRNAVKGKSESFRKDFSGKTGENLLAKKRLPPETLKNFEKLLQKLSEEKKRLAELANGIESRIKKFEEQGKDMTVPKQKLEAAKGKISELDSIISSAKTNIENELKSFDGKNSREKIKVEIEKVREALKKAHRALIEVVISIKGRMTGRVPGNGATTTNSQ